MSKKEIILILLLVLSIAVLVSPLASSWPDGLEKVAGDLGFLHKSETRPVFTCPVADYLWPGIKNKKIAIALAGLSGTLLVFTLGYSLARLLKRKA